MNRDRQLAIVWTVRVNPAPLVSWHFLDGADLREEVMIGRHQAFGKVVVRY